MTPTSQDIEILSKYLAYQILKLEKKGYNYICIQGIQDFPLYKILATSIILINNKSWLSWDNLPNAKAEHIVLFTNSKRVIYSCPDLKSFGELIKSASGMFGAKIELINLSYIIKKISYLKYLI
jgi:hypothetical protein